MSTQFFSQAIIYLRTHEEQLYSAVNNNRAHTPTTHASYTSIKNKSEDATSCARAQLKTKLNARTKSALSTNVRVIVVCY